VALATGSRRAVSVREKGLLRIRGRRLGDVSEVLFLGGAGRSDNMGVEPAVVRSTYVEVKMPVGAPSGKLVLLDPNGHTSRPSRPQVRVLLDPTAQSNVGFIWPVRGMITGVFGENRGDHRHAGIDIALPTGRPIKAAASGVVVLAGNQGGYGLFTCLRHARYVTCYAHQSQIRVSYGQQVRQGDVIGLVGSTGHSTGSHLHFEVRQGPNPWSTPMDPMKFLPRR
jgi:murein DD-endopeptidase MepM/ murein hydrolase activator NlpD